MEKNDIIKCSFKEHLNSNANIYCSYCKIFMCNKCEKHHSELFTNHELFTLNKDIKEIFTGFCKEENHFDKLEYFCKTHNQLCCAACIVKIKTKGKGQHTDCNVCTIEDIKLDKKNSLQKNINYLKNLFSSLEESIKELKKSLEKLDKNKEELKIQIQKIFTNIRNEINNREDELLNEVDKEFNKKCFNETSIKEYEKLPNDVKIQLEKGNKIVDNWNDETKLSLLIYECLNIENNIKNIENLNSNIMNYASLNKEIVFEPDTEEIKKLLNSIKNFGEIFKKDDFQKSPIILNNYKDYSLSGENKNIITKIGENCYRGTLILNELSKNEEYSWKIKIINSFDNNHFYIGLASSDFNTNEDYRYCGWYLYCWNSTLNSGPPFNYHSKETNLKKVENEVIINMNMKTRTLKFIIDNEDKGESYSNIPFDKPLYPAVFLYYTNDSIQFIKLNK